MEKRARKKVEKKEARLILQSGIIYFFYQYFERHGLPSSGVLHTMITSDKTKLRSYNLKRRIARIRYYKTCNLCNIAVKRVE